MKALAWIVGILLIGLGVMFVIDDDVSDEEAATTARRQAVEAWCDREMSASGNGRTTQDACDRMRASNR
jgi:hypothetical protein